MLSKCYNSIFLYGKDKYIYNNASPWQKHNEVNYNGSFTKGK